MRIKKFIKLINNERTKSGFVSAKACDQSAFDLCNKGHAGCFNNSEEILFD